MGGVNCFLLVAAPLHRQTIVVDDFSETLSALLAAAACIFTAARGRGRTRQAWGLIGIAAALWGLGQVAWTYQEVILGLVPANLFPSYPDLGYLLSVPFAIVGLLGLALLLRGVPDGPDPGLQFVAQLPPCPLPVGGLGALRLAAHLGPRRPVPQPHG